MQINSDAIIQDAQKLRASSEDIRSYKAGDQGTRAALAAQQIELTLDQMNVNLRTHQQTVARLQLETIGLDQIEKNLNFIIKNNPGAFDDLKRVVTEVQSAIEATRYQQQYLIPRNLRDALYADILLPGMAQDAMQMLGQRREEIEKNLKNEFAQISRIQVSFENIQSLNMPLEGRAQSVVEELAKQLVAQQKLVQSPMDPTTVMNLLRN
ncbi:MAG: hypothetical protein LBC99_07155 [Spirochaetota bacterium]|jgi:hypothetical protein|nr:hypothetical protein [Spirochaetota bacterium]